MGLSTRRRLLGLAEQIRRLANMESDSLEALIQQELVSKRCLAGAVYGSPRKPTGLADLAGLSEWQQFLSDQEIDLW